MEVFDSDAMLLLTLIFTLFVFSSCLKLREFANYNPPKPFKILLAPSFQKCNRKQPDLKECLLKAAQNGLSQLGRPILRDFNIPSLNPAKVVEATISSGTGPVQVEQKLRNCEIRGLPLGKLDTFE